MCKSPSSTLLVIKSYVLYLYNTVIFVCSFISFYGMVLLKAISMPSVMTELSHYKDRLFFFAYCRKGLYPFVLAFLSFFWNCGLFIHLWKSTSPYSTGPLKSKNEWYTVDHMINGIR